MYLYLVLGLDVKHLCFYSKWLAQAWWLIVIIMYATYIGNLMASLAVSHISIPFTSLSGMAAQTTYSYGVEDGIIQHMLFKVGGNGVEMKRIQINIQNTWLNITNAEKNIFTC